MHWVSCDLLLKCIIWTCMYCIVNLGLFGSVVVYTVAFYSSAVHS